jgi:hypothetical protein
MVATTAVSKKNGVAPLDPGSIYYVTDCERRNVAALLELFEYNPYDHDPELFFVEAELTFAGFPCPLRRRVLEFRDCGNRDGILLIRGFPRDPVVPPTPVRPHVDVERPTHYGEILMACIARALGQPAAYLQEDSGHLYQYIYPKEDQGYKQTSAVLPCF